MPDEMNLIEKSKPQPNKTLHSIRATDQVWAMLKENAELAQFTRKGVPDMAGAFEFIVRYWNSALKGLGVPKKEEKE
jgi:hypothetical protein